ncbi:MAG TPA: twin-arginine translocation signal domain-containing protein, partial [Gemmatimonadetes bacterium]|nr:twin-arginine translocation signal domain-containing protein [Gemmatimonadota bacterium]
MSAVCYMNTSGGGEINVISLRSNNLSRRTFLNAAGLTIASAAFAPIAGSAEMSHRARIEAALT